MIRLFGLAGVVLLLAAFLTLPGAARAWAAEGRVVGGVARIQGQVSAERGGMGRMLAQGSPVREGDRLRTEPEARLEVQFLDGTVVTLSGDTVFSLDAFALDQDQRRGDALFTLAAGAFRAVTGVTASERAHLQVQTPLATIGIRGTDFWGGWLDAAGFGVLLLSGREVSVANRVGTVVLDRPGLGVTVPAADEPMAPPVQWPQEKLGRAVRTVTFGQAGQGQ
jgi:hypothetical protein